MSKVRIANSHISSSITVHRPHHPMTHSNCTYIPHVPTTHSKCTYVPHDPTTHSNCTYIPHIYTRHSVLVHIIVCRLLIVIKTILYRQNAVFPLLEYTGVQARYILWCYRDGASIHTHHGIYTYIRPCMVLYMHAYIYICIEYYTL